MTTATNVRYVVSTLPGSVRCTDGTTVVFTQPPDDDDGSAGVREPRRPGPKTPAPATAAVR